jgi:hypothetical protein
MIDARQRANSSIQGSTAGDVYPHLTHSVLVKAPLVSAALMLTLAPGVSRN